jgi:predicted SnoaL-like aldol condensation-catalyzing enzyme
MSRIAITLLAGSTADERCLGAVRSVTFDVFRVRNGKLVEHWDGAVINPPVAGGRGQ